MCPAASATSRHFPKPTAAGGEAGRQAGAGRGRIRRCPARRSASSTAPDDLLVDADGTPLRIDKAYSWEAPLRRPWPDAHGDRQCGASGDPYPIDVLFMYMANMSWNSAMNVPDTIAASHRQGRRRRRHTSSRTSSIPTPMPPRWSHYADLILPDTTYLERWDCISLLDRPISEADGPADVDPPARGRSRIVTCGRSRTCCSISAHGSACPA